MASTPQDCLYAKSHEWVRIDGDQVTIGISDFAQHELGDVVFVELPDVGRTLSVGDSFGTVESVKAVSEVYAPVSGEVIEVNQALLDEPESINTDSYGEGWMIKLRTSNLESDKSNLLDAAAYDQYTAEAGH
jgi:glycine cleavage system H protein